MMRLFKKKPLWFFVSLVIFLTSQLIFTEKSIPKSNSRQHLVKRVIDGDTIELENKQIVRYIGVDSPELHHPKKTVECFASASAEFNRKLVEGKIVRLEKDVSEIDKYKRLLRYVYLVNQSSPSAEIFINKKLVDEGFAYSATFPPDVKYSEVFRQSQQEAMNNNKGLWKSCSK